MKKLSLAAAALVSSVVPAFAHHPLNGMPMETFTHGVLSGVGHPILGFDHLFFVIAVGIAAALSGRMLSGPLAFLAAMVAGVVLILNGVVLPYVEFAIALSLLAVGGVLAMGRQLPVSVLFGLFAVAGLFHGWAFGESIVGQEGGTALSVVAGYLIGLSAAQWIVAVLAGFAVTRIAGATTAQDIPGRLAGAAVAGIGGFLVLEALEGPALAALGLG